jgi:hypothetical protein
MISVLITGIPDAMASSCTIPNGSAWVMDGNKNTEAARPQADTCRACVYNYDLMLSENIIFCCVLLSENRL